MGTVGGALAQPSFLPQPTDALSASEGKTYLDLLRLVMPAIAVNGTTYSGGQPIGVRHLGGLGHGTVEPAPTGQLKLIAVPLRSGGMERMALLIDFENAEPGISLALLALFDIVDEPRLLDTVDIALDRWTSFLDPVRLSVSTSDDLLVTQSTHSNSSQHYAIVALILVRDDRFELVDMIALLSDRDCSFERSQSLVVEQGGKEPVADIVAIVTERMTLAAKDCDDRAGPEPGSRTIAVT
ncbi:MAG: hypothetical protein WBA88_25900 [Pseudaminobacter sp.]